MVKIRVHSYIMSIGIVMLMTACHYIVQKQKYNDAQEFTRLKPILQRGDQVAKKALDRYLLMYKENAVGNPFAELQESPHAVEAIDLYETAYHRVNLDQRWHQAWRTLWTEGMQTGQAAFEQVLADYKNDPRGNSYAVHLREAIKSLKDQEYPSQWTTQSIRWMGVDRFCMAEHEVSVEQYKLCVEAGACEAAGTGEYCLWDKAGYDAMPINCVTWQQAQNYAQWVGGRLATQDEWLYAFKAGKHHKQYPWGDEVARCVHGAISGEEEACSSQMQAICRSVEGRSMQGVCDLLGNVKEWINCEAEECKLNYRNYIGSSWRDRVYMSAVEHQQTKSAPLTYSYYDLGIRPVKDCFDDDTDHELDE